MKYDKSAVYIFLGADYKTFTLGLKQFYRLLSASFVHGSFLHLVCNLYALFYAGTSLENAVGRPKFIIIFIYTALMASLAQEILSDNSVLLGISGSLYGMFAFFLLLLHEHTTINWKELAPMLFLNLCLNFLSSTAWLAHLGGAVGGLIMFLMFERNEGSINKAGLAVAVIAILFMFCRYVTIKEISPLYGGTDMQVVKIYSDLGFKALNL